ncbi:MAG: YbaB/EbfC family nucleoid-associated protein [Spirochaetaceae bacterium]|jgi:DNA-binding YbaB/EbfC family protein|nr:YbaB/EbfC family nucleoid-associated protein [Spirochaetaceae bacterium]
MDIPEELLKNAQKFNSTMDKLKDKIGCIVVTGSAGGGMVEVDMNGKQEMLAVRIMDKSIAEDTEMLQDLILAAYSAAIERVGEAVSTEIGSFTGIISKLLPDDLRGI